MDSEWVIKVTDWAEKQSDESIKLDLDKFKSNNIKTSESAYKRLRKAYGKAQSESLDRYISSGRIGTKNRLQDALLDPIEPPKHTRSNISKTKLTNTSTKSKITKIKSINTKVNKPTVNSVSPILLKYTTTGSIGMTLGLGSLIGLKSRLRKKYPNKSEDELDSMVYKYALSRGISGYLAGLVLCGLYDLIKSKFK